MHAARPRALPAAARCTLGEGARADSLVRSFSIAAYLCLTNSFSPQLFFPPSHRTTLHATHADANNDGHARACFSSLDPQHDFHKDKQLRVLAANRKTDEDFKKKIVQLDADKKVNDPSTASVDVHSFNNNRLHLLTFPNVLCTGSKLLSHMLLHR